MRITTALLAFCALAALAACTTDLTPAAQKVRIVSAKTVAASPHCYQFLGRVEGSSSQTGVLEHQGFQNAVNEMLNKAATMGANAVVMSPHSDSYYWAFSEEAAGQAYRYTCGPTLPPAEASATGQNS